MNVRVAATLDAEKSLRRVENVLDRVLGDLQGDGTSPPGGSCADALGRAFAELQFFGGLLLEKQADQSSLLPQANALLPKLKAAERLLHAAAEFYRGWCAVGPPPGYPAPDCYPTSPFVNGPALLVLEG